MTNREKYKDEIIDIVCSGKNIAINRRTNEPCGCGSIECIECASINNMVSCKQKFTEWCNAEYVEPCPFEKDEIVEVSENGKTWCIRHFSHISEDIYFVFVDGRKSTETTNVCSWQYCRKYGTLGGLVKEPD